MKTKTSLRVAVLAGLLGLAMTFTAYSASEAPSKAAGARSDYPRVSVPFTAVRVEDDFWSPRLATNRLVTIPHNLRELEKHGSLGGFAILAGTSREKYHGYMWGDSDVYKTIEGICYSLATSPDPVLQQKLQEIVAWITAAQQPDGYLMPHVQLAEPNYEHFSDEYRTCELYCMGHLIEAAAAHHDATGRGEFLNVAVKCADLLCRTYGPGRSAKAPGHPELELALVRLYRATGDSKYLRLAGLFVERARSVDGTPWSDGRPLLGHGEARGHAVAACYLYCGATDVGVLTGERALLDLLGGKWENMVSRRMYLTGGIGVSTHGEGFGGDYELPNVAAYNETCAAIASALWTHRMFLLHGDGKYGDVLERVLYNTFLAGVAITGDRFFYPNPLEADGQRRFNHGSCDRTPWFGCPCCPVNVVRFLPRLPGMIYAVRDDVLYVNLFVGSVAKLKLADTAVELRQHTAYPWDGKVALTLTPEKAAAFTLRLRIPGWARNRPVPSDLYRYTDSEPPPPRLAVNDQPEPLVVQSGFAELRRHWQAGDTVTLELPMPVRRVVAHPEVKEDRGRFAVERGPLVCCAEGVDNGDDVLDRALGAKAAFSTEVRATPLRGLVAVKIQPEARGDALTAIPYFAWAHRGVGEMAVWLAEGPRPWRASHCWPRDTVEACFDGIEPRSSNDLSVPRLTWWDHRGTVEWVQRRFPEPRRVSGVAVYWFDDTGTGQCRVPQSWRVLFLEDNRWQPVAEPSDYGTQRDRLNRVAFKPVTTLALRLEVQLQRAFSGGILEWRIEE